MYWFDKMPWTSKDHPNRGIGWEGQLDVMKMIYVDGYKHGKSKSRIEQIRYHIPYRLYKSIGRKFDIKNVECLMRVN